MNSPDPARLMALRLGFRRYTKRPWIWARAGWLALIVSACAGGYAVGDLNDLQPNAAISDQLTACYSALKVSEARKRELDELLMLETSILDDCRISCGVMIRKDPP